MNGRVAQVDRASALEPAGSPDAGLEQRSRDMPKVGGSSPAPAHRFFFRDKVSQHPGECHYLNRWVIDFRWFSIRLHHWIGSDDDRHPHDHPWWFVSLLLWGRLEENVNGAWRRRRGIAAYPAAHSHCVRATNAWTLLLTGPARRDWGFTLGDRWVTKRQYFKSVGHHQCERSDED